MTRSEINVILSQHPGLGAAGFTHWTMGQNPQQRAEQQERNIADAHTDEFVLWCNRSCEWLATIGKIKSMNTRNSSYGLKHIAENEFGYIANGAFIVAAIHCGFEFQREGPNACFNMSQKSINIARERSNGMLKGFRRTDFIPNGR